jgi:signal transduction histidine kinase/DNA-binding response OmpR family regulator/ABC-type sugar transport system substrate-binding protein
MPAYKHGRPTVGVVAGWQLYEGTLHSYFQPLSSGIHAAALDRDCNLLLACGVSYISRDGKIPPIRPAWPVQASDTDFVPVGPWNTDGLLVVLPLLSEARSTYIEQLIANHYPIVFVGTGEEGPTVVGDNEGGTWQAIRHLVEHGHRRIAYIGGEAGFHSDSYYRLQAYRAAVQEYGLEADDRLIVYGFNNKPGGYRAMNNLLDSGVEFTAVLASNDEEAFGAMQALREAGRRIPEDVAVIGFDDRLEAMAQVPALSTVHYPVFETGYRGLEVLLRVMAGEEINPEVIRVPTRLITRESCGCPKGGFSSAEGDFDREEQKPFAIAAAPLGERAETASDSLPLKWQLLQAMKTAALIESRQLRPLEVGNLCRRMLEGFELSLKERKFVHFRSAMAELLQHIEAANEDAYAWQAAVSVLRSKTSELFRELELPEELHSSMEDLLHQARIAISESTRRNHIHYIDLQTYITNHLGLMTSRLQAALDEPQIFEILAEDLPGLGIEHAQVGFFGAEGDDPAAWTTLRVHSGTGKGVLERFPSREFPPPNLYPADKPFRLACLPLIFQDRLSGFVAFDAGNMEASAIIIRQLAAALKSARLYQEAAEGRQLAEEANRLKSRFLSTVSHELRTPLNLIAGLSEMMLREQAGPEPPPPEQYREDLERIHTSAQHLGGLIRDVLDLASSETGQLKLAREPLDLGLVISVVSETGAQMARDKGLTWEANVPAMLPKVWGDRTRLRQVAINLITNAIKFTARGKVALNVEIGADQVKISVSDTGLGIPVKEQQVIFDEFRQSERTTARGYGGLGLGLAICKRLVELHGGQIGVKSSGDEGGGSTFYFTLPILEKREATPEPVAAPPTNQPQTVLLLAEEVGHGDRLREHLREQGFEVDVCLVNGNTDLFSELLTTPPGAVVMDAGLASERGWEILKVLKGNPATQDVPVLFYSLTEEGDTGFMLEMDYLMKPVETGALAQALARQGITDIKEDGEEKTVLIVDDEPGILEMHARMVQAQSSGYRILKARDGREALTTLAHSRVDLVLLDLMMPEIDGFGVLEAMRRSEFTRDVPVIVLTAQVLSETDMARLNQGVATVLGKGLFNAQETLAHMEAALARNRKLGNEAQRLVRKAMAYLHTHYAELVSREGVARYVGVSESYLTRCFHQETGVTPMVYLNRYRVNKAKELLLNGEKSVTEVAMAVGFSDSNYFGRVFRREVGVSPGAFRRGRVVD